VSEFERICKEPFDTAYRFLMRLCCSAPLAGELAQETFFRVLHAIGKLDGRCRVEEAILDRDQAMAIHAPQLHELPESYKGVFMLRVFGKLEYAQTVRLGGEDRELGVRYLSPGEDEANGEDERGGSKMRHE